MKLPTPKHIALTQVRMSQQGGIRSSFVMHKYNAFCAYLKAGNLNILVYRGKRHFVIEEAEKLSKYLDIKVVDLFPRDEEGNVIDDDYHNVSQAGCIVVFAILILLIILFGVLFPR